MKKIIIIISILFTISNANSQIAKTYWMYGGSGEYYHKTTKLESGYISKYSYITVKANAGYFIKDKWAVGGIVRYDDNLSPHDYNRNAVAGLGIYTRYYFLNPYRKTNIFSQINYTYSVNLTQSNFENKTLNSHQYGFIIGYVVFLSNSVGLETFLEYEKSIHPPANRFETTDISIIVKAGIGFHIHLIK